MSTAAVPKRPPSLSSLPRILLTSLIAVLLLLLFSSKMGAANRIEAPELVGGVDYLGSKDPIRLKDRLSPRRQLEDAPHHGLLCPMPHHIGRSLPAKQQRKRIDQDRLTRARLTGQQV